MARHYLTLPDIEYGIEPFSFPELFNRLGVYTDLFGRVVYDVPRRFLRFGASGWDENPFHCFVDDWRLESIWRSRHKMIHRILSCGIAVAPDFTVEKNDPLPHAFYQVWRSRVVARWWQDHGVTVVPVLQWSRPEINRYLFSGLDQCEIVAVRSPTRGYEREWLQCAEQFLTMHQPKLVLHFGTKNGFDVWPNALNLNLKGKIK